MVANIKENVVAENKLKTMVKISNTEFCPTCGSSNIEEIYSCPRCSLLLYVCRTCSRAFDIEYF